MRPIVFLDFDDVLAVHREHSSVQVLFAFRHSALDDVAELWESVFDISACANLRTLHGEFAPEYIISSSWSSFLTRAQICEVLRRTGLEFVGENLHETWATPRPIGSDRLAEIDAWLDTHALLAPFLILDDLISGHSIRGSHLEERSVLCDAWIGFTPPKLELAQSILRGQLK